MMQRIGETHLDEKYDLDTYNDIQTNNWIGSCLAMTKQDILESVLMRYTDFASL